MAKKFKIGDKLKMHGKEYKITGTHKRSFIYELVKRDGKQYVATTAKLEKMVAYEEHQFQKANDPRYYLKKRLAYTQIFKPEAKLSESESESELMVAFERVYSDLSPENLTCDGEASTVQIKQRYRDLRAELKELEKLIGRKVSEEETFKYCQNNK